MDRGKWLIVGGLLALAMALVFASHGCAVNATQEVREAGVSWIMAWWVAASFVSGLGAIAASGAAAHAAVEL
jgi:hypothetical protein